MKVTTLLGSAKKTGNTATVLGWIEEELISLDHDVERIYLNNKSISGCLGCAKCRENPDEIACVQKDDAIDIIRASNHHHQEAVWNYQLEIPVRYPLEKRTHDIFADAFNIGPGRRE